MRAQRGSRGQRHVDNSVRRVCAAVERTLGAALGSISDPVLGSLAVVRVVPAPSLARLLVVVGPTSRDGVLDADDVLERLARVRGQLRGEVASELNKKRTPELSFTLGSAVDEGDAGSDGTLGRAVHGADASPLDAHGLAVSATGSDVSHGVSATAGDVSGEPRRDEPLVTQAAAPAPGVAKLAWAPKKETPRNQKRTLRREARLRRRRGRADAGEVVSETLAVTTEVAGGAPIKRWTRGVPVEDAALAQLENIARLPFVHRWVAAMPDVHLGIGATVGSVIATSGAIVPAAVGVDIGCGMMAVRTTLRADQLPDRLAPLRTAIERAVPHGRGKHGGRGDLGSWRDVPERVGRQWAELEKGFERIAGKHPAVRKSNHAVHLGTLGTGNHFIEVCIDDADGVWVMLHSGSRGVGNKIGTHFIALAKKDMRRQIASLPDEDLAYFSEGSEHFDDYVEAVEWAQRFAKANRELMMTAVLGALRRTEALPPFRTDQHAVDCHHNYVASEHHYGKDVLVTRKGAVRAGVGELGIIPGSMGARSFIVRGKGQPESFCSCSHGAGRVMSRNEARRRFTLDDHVRMTEGVECRKDASVTDETPAAYKDIDAVMAAQRDLVSVEHTLRQVICVKG